ncbi:GTP-dependent dephospho-CoA kinase family protein [[Eubacterium] cellulosolvens]
MAKLILPRKLRATLKSPMGELLTGDEEQNMKALKKIVIHETPPRVICVGDAVSRNAIKAGESSWIKIVDGKEMRKEVGLDDFHGSRIFLVKNEPGTISYTAWEAVSNVIKNEGSILIVKGEEDLLTLPAILEAPNKSIVIYGQPPRAGVIVVRVNNDSKMFANSIIGNMICDSDHD